MLKVTSVSRISEKQGSAGITTLVLRLCGQKMATGIFHFPAGWFLGAAGSVPWSPGAASLILTVQLSHLMLPSSVGLPRGKDFLKSKRISPNFRFFESVLLKIHGVFKY